MMTVEAFHTLISTVCAAVAGKPVDTALADLLNENFPPDGETFQAIEAACRTAAAEGWMCNYGEPPLRYGRVIKPSDALAGFSVDVVEMDDVKGPHHRHPNGEIDMIMPVDADAKFDGHGAGWLVYGPDTAHSPTVTGGKAFVLYLLPGGAIEFTKA